jgi:integrase
MIDAWGDRPLAGISKADIRAFLDHGPSASARSYRRVSAFLSWCVEQDMIATNITTTMPRPPKGKPRRRVLSDAELVAVWHAAGKCGRYGQFVRLLMLTGCRRSEIANLTFSEIGADAISLPGERTKNGHPHIIYLTESMRKVLRDYPMKRIPSGNYAINSIRASLPPDFAHFTLHDLRRTFRTGLARLGIPPWVGERCVNHRTVESEIEQILQRASV